MPEVDIKIFGPIIWWKYGMRDGSRGSIYVYKCFIFHIKLHNKYLISLLIPLNILLWGGKTWSLDNDLLGSIEVFLYQCVWIFLEINMNIMEEYNITNYYERSKFYDILIIDNNFSKYQLTYIGGNFTTPSTIPPTKYFIIGEKERDELELFWNKMRFCFKIFPNRASNWQASNSTYLVILHPIQPILTIYNICYHLTSLNTSVSINTLFMKAFYKFAHVTYPEIPSEKVRLPPPPTHTHITTMVTVFSTTIINHQICTTFNNDERNYNPMELE